MPDTTDAPKPMTESDVTASKTSRTATPLKGATIENGDGSKFIDPKLSLSENASNIREQAGEKARSLAEDGKTRASGALEQLSQMLTEAAGNVDEKLGTQYGQYARTAADKVQGFSSTIDQTSIDDLVDSAREFVRKSPAVAIGAAAAMGFVVARLLTAGLDQRDKG